MKDNPSNSTLEQTSGLNATRAQLTNGVHRVNGNSKRKHHDAFQNGSRPTKKQVVYMDEEEEQDNGKSPEVNGSQANGISTSPLGAKLLHKKKSNGNIGHSASRNAKYLALQEQRRQLPIARGMCKTPTPNMRDLQNHILREGSSH